MLNITISPLESGQRYTWPPMFTEVAPPDHPWHAFLISSSVGSLDELVGSTDSELVGSMASELAGSAAELLDSSADEMASMRELLTGSWLMGMLMELLEAAGFVSAGVASAWLELAGPSVWLELLSVSGELTESGMGSTTWSEVGDELSSQALNANDAVMPSVAAMALLTFLFSIFTNTSTLCPKIHFFKGKRL